ncbi:glycosyltransferase family 2 protein [Geodermatophilus sp. DF01-2]|uniref:glycosyltransferase family 2 protein n=1 Tax=Geodermatophilus sp. DF01-2 TaxID=2559610 RepID=UPI0014311E09|nr:glycosyltransferase family 2 protein [Geodermatophilus sp. DF01_2]
MPKLMGARGITSPPMKGGLAVGCVVRDAEEYVDAFIEHYISLGAEQILFLDNGSLDGTVERIQRHPAFGSRVHLNFCRLRYGRWEVALKQFLANVLGEAGGWVLVADIDEHLSLPFASQDAYGLRAVLGYLDECGYSVVVTQMIDVFPPVLLFTGSQPLNVAEHRYFEWQSVNAHEYASFVRMTRCAVIAPEEVGLAFLTDGVRHRLYGLQRPLWLTKHSLLRPSAGAWLRHAHLAQAGQVADFSCPLIHYAFTGRLREKVEAVVRQGRYGASANEEYRRYARRLGQLESVRIASEGATPLTSPAMLVERGLVVASRRYRKEMQKSNAEAYADWVPRGGLRGEASCESAG